MARLLLGVSGGIAAYKSLEFVRLAIKAGHVVRVIQTPTSERFVGKASFEALTGAPVLISEFERDPARGAFPDQTPPDHEPISHLQLVRNADLMIVAPASANTIAKLATGVADSLLCTAALAAPCPVAIAPAMNNQMFLNPATQANLATLRERGITVLDPDTGQLGSKGEWGVGRLREPSELLSACEQLLARGVPQPMDGLNVLVTAGGTREPIDSVRYIGNRSSGRMGFALASEALHRGANVTVIAANVALPRSPHVTYVDVETAAQLQAASQEKFPSCDLLLMAAAVADYRPSDVADTKIKKEQRTLALSLERTDDVLTSLALQRIPGQTVVGFAAEHGDGLEAARIKLARKDLDAIIVNDISRQDIGFDSEANEVIFVSAAGESLIPRATKAEIAAAILDLVLQLRSAPTAYASGSTLST